MTTTTEAKFNLIIIPMYVPGAKGEVVATASTYRSALELVTSWTERITPITNPHACIALLREQALQGWHEWDENGEKVAILAIVSAPDGGEV